MPKTTRIEEMARWVESVSFDDIPPRVIDRARYQLLNMIAAAHAGAISPAALKLMEAARKWDSGGELPVVATGETLSLHGALFVNTALSMAHDFDDYLFLGHSCHSAVFASILVGMAEGKSPRDIIAAQVIGNEIGGRLGAACLIGPQNGQMWTHIHIAGTAAIAAKLMGLDKKSIANAIAIGFYQPPFALAPGFMGPDTKILSASQTSLAGLMAAQLAREGFTGPLDIFENPRGFLAQFSYAPLEFMFSGWGKSWVTDSLAYKMVPGCAYIDTCVDAMKMIFEKFRAKTGRDMAPSDVREIEVRASLLTIGMNHMSEDHVGRGVLNPIAINFSIPANVAILILTGDLRVEHLDPDWLDLHREDILALCRRVNLVHDWEMSMGVTRAMNKVLDLGRLVDAVGLKNLLKARRRAAAHFGTGVSLGIKDFMDMRNQAGSEGKDYVGKMASGALKRIIGGKKPRRLSSSIDLGECDFSKFKMPFAAQVSIKTADWQEYTARQDIPWGSPGQPWDDTMERLREKFRIEAGRHLSIDQIDWVIENIGQLEKISSAQELMENLAASPDKKAADAKRYLKSQPAKEAESRDIRTGTKTHHIKKSLHSDLPPVSFEPVGVGKKERVSGTKMEAAPARTQSIAAKAPAMPKPVAAKMPAAPKPVAARAPAKTETAPKAKSASVRMRPAAPRAKSPRPPKGAKRRRLKRP